MTPAEDYEWVTQKCCPKCAHVHPEREACVLQARCTCCGFPVGLVPESDVDFTECRNCIREAQR